MCEEKKFPIEITDETCLQLGIDSQTAMNLHEYWGRKWIKKGNAFWLKAKEVYGVTPPKYRRLNYSIETHLITVVGCEDDEETG